MVLRCLPFGLGLAPRDIVARGGPLLLGDKLGATVGLVTERVHEGVHLARGEASRDGETFVVLDLDHRLVLGKDAAETLQHTKLKALHVDFDEHDFVAAREVDEKRVETVERHLDAFSFSSDVLGRGRTTEGGIVGTVGHENLCLTVHLRCSAADDVVAVGDVVERGTASKRAAVTRNGLDADDLVALANGVREGDDAHVAANVDDDAVQRNREKVG